MMRILHVGKYYPPHMGGTEIYTRDLVRLQSAAADVQVVVANDCAQLSREQRDGAAVTRLPRICTIASMPITRGLTQFLASTPADIVHIHMPNPIAAMSFIASSHRGTLILTHHADTVGRRALRLCSDPFVRAAMRRAGGIIVTSRRYMETSRELADVQSKCHVIPLGIDANRFAAVDEGKIEAIRDRFGNRIVLGIGRLVPFKGFQYAIEAMTMIDKARLVIVGSGPMEGDLRRLIRANGLEGRVDLVGEIGNEQVPAFLKAARLLVFPSARRTESFGYVQLEAMACGVPVVNTDIGTGTSDVSLHGVTGLTVEPGSARALAAAINLLLDDEVLSRRLGNAGIERVRREYSVLRMGDATFELYREALGNKPSAIAALGCCWRAK